MKGKSVSPGTQWRPGQSGNPQGRTRGGRSAIARDLIAELLVRRKTAKEIAESEQMVNLFGRPRSVRWVRKEIKAIEIQWQQNAARDLGSLRSEMLASLLGALREAWAAYGRTVGTNTVTFKEAKGGQQDSSKEKASAVEQKKIAVREEQLAGSHEWMGKILQITKQICELMGLDAPVQIDVRDRDIESMSDAELQQAVTEAALRFSEDSSNNQHGKYGPN